MPYNYIYICRVLLEVPAAAAAVRHGWRGFPQIDELDGRGPASSTRPARINLGQAGAAGGGARCGGCGDQHALHDVSRRLGGGSSAAAGVAGGAGSACALDPVDRQHDLRLPCTFVLACSWRVRERLRELTV